MSKITAARWPKYYAQEDLLASAQPRHRTPLESAYLGKSGHYIRYLLLIMLVLVFAVVSKNFWSFYSPRALWNLMPSQSSIIIHDPENFDWETASSHTPNRSLLANMNPFLDYTIIKIELSFLL